MHLSEYHTLSSSSGGIICWIGLSFCTIPEVLWLRIIDESYISDNLEDLSDILVDEEVAEELNVDESCGLRPYSLKYGCESASCAEILPFGSNFSKWVNFRNHFGHTSRTGVNKIISQNC